MSRMLSIIDPPPYRSSTPPPILPHTGGRERWCTSGAALHRPPTVPPHAGGGKSSLILDLRIPPRPQKQVPNVRHDLFVRVAGGGRELRPSGWIPSGRNSRPPPATRTKRSCRTLGTCFCGRRGIRRSRMRLDFPPPVWGRIGGGVDER